LTIPTDPFTPAPGLSDPHLQTMWGVATRTRNAVPTRRELLPVPDGEVLYLDHLDGPAASPRVLLLHGLEGSSRSVYIQGLLVGLARLRWRATVLNFRSCALGGRPLSALPVTRPRLYHSGETSDLDHVARHLAGDEPGVPLFAVGFSLGGNVLLKWLGENGARAPLAAAAAVSVPFDLGAGARHMELGLRPLYVWNFLRTLRTKTRDVVRRFPEAAARIDLPRALAASSFHAFDDAANAPLHGFAGADDYYARCSSLGFLPRVAVPSLCLNSADDPFLPAEALGRAAAAASPCVRIVTTPAGGHVGFVGRSSGGLRYWAEEQVLEWLRRAGR
jgi:predicted alpha/beta-fold hydrolase